jgi:hypothetical protein
MTGAHVAQSLKPSAPSPAAKPFAHAPLALRPLLSRAQQVAFAWALDEVFVIGALVAFAGALVTLLLVRGRDLLRGCSCARFGWCLSAFKRRSFCPHHKSCAQTS